MKPNKILFFAEIVDLYTSLEPGALPMSMDTIDVSVRPHGLFYHAAVTVLRQIDTGRNRKYRNRNRRRNCGRIAPMRPGFDYLAAVTVTESAVTVTAR